MYTMCPDRQLLSVYFDGELPSPWKEKLDGHLESCPSCRERLEAYRHLSADLGRAPGEEATQAAQDRVWQRLEQHTGVSRNFTRVRPSDGLWHFRVSIPLPAAAAMALLFVALALFLVLRPPNTVMVPNMAFETPEFILDSDMEDVLQYLSSRDAGEVFIFQLPESRNFDSYGEPAILRAADYSRKVQGQGQGRRRP